MTSMMMASEEPEAESCSAVYKRLQRAIQGASDGLWEWDLTNQTVWYAPRFLELIDADREDFPNTMESWTDRLHPQDYQKTWDAMQRHLLEDEQYDVKYRLRITDDTYRWFRARGTAYRDDAGLPVCMAGSISDIEDLQQAYFELQEKESQIVQQQKLEAFGSLASGIAHEFNNLLQTMRGYTQFALDTLDYESQASKDLNLALTAAERASVLTRQMLDFSRCDEAEPKPYQIDLVVSDLVDMLKPLLPSNIDLRLDLNAGETYALIDCVQLQQALLNLCINSKDAMPNGGVLLIRTEAVTLDGPEEELPNGLQPGPHLRVTVADSGTGISPDALQHIFEPFYTTKEVGKGTGLGLAVAFGVIQHANGHIECRSSSEKGTKFHIHLPVYDEPMTTIPLIRKCKSWGN